MRNLQFYLNIGLLWRAFIIAFSCFCFSPVFSANESQPLSASVLNDYEKIHKLMEAAQAHERANEYAAAELLLSEASALNQPYFPKSPESFNLTGQLIDVYLHQQKWSEAEKLYETQGRKIWPRQHVDEQVADLLMAQGKYAEARVILRSFVPKLKPPPPGAICGDSYGEYARLKRMLRECEQKANDHDSRPPGNGLH